MAAQPRGPGGVEGPAADRWPECPAIGGPCLAYDVVCNLGSSIVSALLTYLFSAEEGSRLILQKNQDGFSVQVTGAVHRTVAGKDPFGLADVRGLRHRLDELTRRSTNPAA